MSVNIDFSGFFGQAQIIKSLRLEIAGAKARGVPVRDLLLVGNAGLGKTTLAQGTAGEMGVEFHRLCGSDTLRAYTLAECMSKMQAHSILFLDEIQDTQGPVQDVLQRAMTERVVPGFEKDISGRIKQTADVKIQPITVIAATDEPGKLQKALLSRFGLPIALMPYSQQEMKDIVKDRACKLGVVLTDDAATKIAGSCAGIPREAVQHLEMLQNFIAAKQVESITVDVVQECFDTHGISEFGLTDTDRNYLTVVANAGGAGAKLMTLVAVLAQDSTYLQKHIEPKLQRLGLLYIDDRRRLKLKGHKYVERNCK